MAVLRDMAVAECVLYIPVYKIQICFVSTKTVLFCCFSRSYEIDIENSGHRVQFSAVGGRNYVEHVCQRCFALEVMNWNSKTMQDAIGGDEHLSSRITKVSMRRSGETGSLVNKKYRRYIYIAL